MAQTLCIKCGSDLKPSSYCQLCQEPLIFACTSCDYTTEEKVHIDCRNADVLAKTEPKEKASMTTSFKPTGGNQEKSSVYKTKEETVKGDPSSTSSYLTIGEEKKENKNFSNFNPFVAGAVAWQTLMTNSLNAYGEFFKNALKMAEYWYNIYWKPWLDWQQRQQKLHQQDKDKVTVE